MQCGSRRVRGHCFEGQFCCCDELCSDELQFSILFLAEFIAVLHCVFCEFCYCRLGTGGSASLVSAGAVVSGVTNTFGAEEGSVLRVYTPPSGATYSPALNTVGNKNAIITQ